MTNERMFSTREIAYSHGWAMLIAMTRMIYKFSEITKGAVPDGTAPFMFYLITSYLATVTLAT